jgi:hypothetical protein
MGIDSHLSTCVGTQSPKYLEMTQGHISLSGMDNTGLSTGQSPRPPLSLYLRLLGVSKEHELGPSHTTSTGQLTLSHPETPSQCFCASSFIELYTFSLHYYNIGVKYYSPS